MMKWSLNRSIVFHLLRSAKAPVEDSAGDRLDDGGADVRKDSHARRARSTTVQSLPPALGGGESSPFSEAVTTER